MDHVSPKLLTTNVLGVIVWMENAQSYFGLVGAVVGAASAIMLVCINWEKFTHSKPVRRIRSFFNRKSQS